MDSSPLGDILHSIKSFSAKQINREMKWQGSVWLDESFDHIIRHEAEWEEKREYVRQNAVKKGLAAAPDEYKWLYLRDSEQGHRQDACAIVEFEIFEPKTESEVSGGTVNRAKAACVCCGMVLPPERVRAQLAAQRGGADVIFEDGPSGTGFQPVRIGGARLLAVVTLKEGEGGRQYRLPTERDYEAVRNARQRLEKVATEKLPNGLHPVPDEPLPPIGTLGFRVQRYGMLQWGDLFTARQKLALVTLAIQSQGRIAGEAAALSLALAVGRCAEQTSSLVRWRTTVEAVAGTFGRQALPIMWDFVEIVPTGDGGSNFGAALDWVSEVVEEQGRLIHLSGQVEQADACASPLPDDASGVWFTDPPYYDAVPYADLSDFFFVWLKRTLPQHPLLHDPFDPQNPLTPKIREAVQDEVKQVNGRPKDRAFFEETMARAFAEGRRVLRDEGLACVVFAHKTTEGWEALLSGLIRGGWVITGSWPIATERPGRLRSQESAALATSIHLVCRPRTEEKVGDWAKVLRELPTRVGDWMERLQAEGVRGADLVFACIGPALEIYSQYAKVVDAEEREIPLGGDPEAAEPHKRGFLAYVWEVVGRAALEQVLGTAEAKARNGAAGALEEDARLTALFLWTLQSSNGGTGFQPVSEEGEEQAEEEEDTGKMPVPHAKGFSLVFDVARRFAQPLGIHLPDWEGRIIETEKGIVRLLPVSERAKQLFGEDGAEAVADQLEQSPKGAAQLTLFPRTETESQPVRVRGRARKEKVAQASSLLGESTGKMPVPHVSHQATTLDRVHAAMLLQAGGRTNALRVLLEAETQRSPDFLRLANALSALYPKECEEKRLLDAMLLAVPR